MRGSPHAHIVLWLCSDNETMKQKVVLNGVETEIDVPKPAPCYKNSVFGKTGAEREEGKKELIDFIHSLVTIENTELATRNIHGHTFTCKRKNGKIIKIQPNEGHGKFKAGDRTLLVSPICRFGFPRYPMPDSKLLEPLNSDNCSEEDMKVAKNNLKKIQKFMIRQTHTYRKGEISEERRRFLKLTFKEFLEHLEMDEETYSTAIRTSIKGQAQLFLQRNPDQVFINNYNKPIMEKHNSNQDLSVVIDEWQVAQYLVSYLTKSEAGCSKLLRQLDEECSKQGIGFSDKLKKFRKALDQTREVSVQEAVYRLMGFPITKASRKVKYISTTDKQQRDGLLKSNLDNLKDGESAFFNSLADYYENRPDEYEDLTQADFTAYFEIISKYQSVDECEDNDDDEAELGNKRPLIYLKNGMGAMRRRIRPAVIQYYLQKSDDYEHARGLLLLFVPFRNEEKEISEQNALKIYRNIKEDAERNEKLQRQISFYQPYQSLMENINDINLDEEEDSDEDSDDGTQTGEHTERFAETTSEADIEKFLQDFNQEKIETTDLMEKTELLRLIRTLNEEQRRVLDDVVERLKNTDITANPIHLYVSGDAGKIIYKYLSISQNTNLLNPIKKHKF